MRTDSPEAADASFEDEPVTWCDVAPWLTGHGTDPEFFWIDDDPADASPEVLRAHCDLIAVLMLEAVPEVSIGELLPLLPGDVDLIPDPALPTRAANWLLQSSMFTTDRIRPVTTAEILKSRGMGTGSVIGLLSRLVELSTDQLARDTDLGPDVVDELLDDLEIIARWRRATGGDDVSLLAPVPAYAPAAVHEARHRLDTLTADTLPVSEQDDQSVAADLTARLNELGERDREVFLARRLQEPYARLEALGEHYGVSRERVRQYEARALTDLAEWLENSRPAQFLLTSAVRMIDVVRPIEVLTAALPPLAEEVGSAERPLWQVLVGLGVPFEVADGWAAAPTLDSAREASRTLVTRRADEFGVLAVTDLAAVNQLALDGEGPRWPARWAADLGYIVYHDHILSATASMEDYAAAILSIHGEPMTPEDLVGRFHVDRSERSLVNQMAGDDRFQRVSRSHWGLRAWGGRTYESIRAAIGDVLDELGGTVELDALIDRLSALDVKPASVTAYAAAPPYRTQAGVVSRAEGGAAARKTPEQTRNLFRVGDAWKLRVTVNREHLRGSGAPLPVGLAAALELEYGDSRRLDSDHGDQALSWTALQPTLGSTRRFFSALGIDEGADVYFVFTDDGRFAVEPID
ncbi:hypothetical protein GOHSU_22_00670 [Gordonia hirsuta DSM 44140 = NBRC 16056]|uniref:RNA polymerase sigma-70 region 4 domain-containing protein n=1 Tax=Gordonia hirsuta DSM 44140 = NBRC 16056 TaxID=1121927 RepID=L7LC11_9ACTN|nr:sigma factor-like helix-turn-helix DNA-binding protein [Gordonia hirsuta]GAC57607.1 hypothetical protein GOHSU_22_00670 [Gordonia hirsuta DSM 44140 = NBRC 16056]